MLDGLAQRLAWAEQLLVAEEIVERVGPQAMGERRRGGLGAVGRRRERARARRARSWAIYARILLVASGVTPSRLRLGEPVLHSVHGSTDQQPGLSLDRRRGGGRRRCCAASMAAGQEERETRKAALHGKHWVAITGKPLAATAGALTFARGGNAVDAACAMLAAAATMWDTLSWGGETQALIFDPRSGKVRAHQRARRRSDRRDAGVLPLARPARRRPSTGRSPP